MKFTHTLHINAKEIEVLCRALDMYRAHVTKMLQEGNFQPYDPKTFHSYRAKVINMCAVMHQIKSMPKGEASERGLVPEKFQE